MKLEPVKDWINAVAILHQRPSPIRAPDPSKGTSRCYLIESVGPKVAEAGYKVGDIVVALKVYDLLFYGGVFRRVTFQADEVFNVVRDVALSEFVLLDGETSATTIALPGARGAVGNGQDVAGATV